MLNRTVLVLNQNYEPLSVCSARRAIVLVFCGKAQILEEFDFKIHTVSQSFPFPSVVRLDLYIRLPQKRIVLSKRNIMKRDVHICQYCGGRAGLMTVDHVIPKTAGGDDSWENLVCACLNCNNLKGNRSPDEAGLTLFRRPKRPNSITFIRHFIGIPDKRWEPYLFMG